MLNLRILSPQKILSEEKVRQLILPSALGEIGILPGHSAFLSNLVPGILKIEKTPGEWEALYIGGGVLHVFGHSAEVLVEVHEKADAIDGERVIKAKERALKRLQVRDDPTVDIGKALAAVERAKARQKLLQYNKKK